DFLLHLLQLHEQLALRRGRSRSPAHGVGAARTVTRGRLPAVTGATFHHFNLSLRQKRQAESQYSQSTAARSHDELLTQFDATVLSPGLLIAAHGHCTLFAVGNQFQLALSNALQNQVALNSLRATLAQSHVVLTGAALISMVFQND